MLYCDDDDDDLYYNDPISVCCACVTVTQLKQRIVAQFVLEEGAVRMP